LEADIHEETDRREDDYLAFLELGRLRAAVNAAADTQRIENLNEHKRDYVHICAQEARQVQEAKKAARKASGHKGKKPRSSEPVEEIILAPRKRGWTQSHESKAAIKRLHEAQDNKRAREADRKPLLKAEEGFLSKKRIENSASIAREDKTFRDVARNFRKECQAARQNDMIQQGEMRRELLALLGTSVVSPGDAVNVPLDLQRRSDDLSSQRRDDRAEEAERLSNGVAKINAAGRAQRRQDDAETTAQTAFLRWKENETVVKHGKAQAEIAVFKRTDELHDQGLQNFADDEEDSDGEEDEEDEEAEDGEDAEEDDEAAESHDSDA
jgi:hypothetical protein